MHQAISATTVRDAAPRLLDLHMVYLMRPAARTGPGRAWSKQALAERERKDLDARTGKLDLDLAIDDGFGLPDQLVQALLRHRAVALLVDIGAVRRAGRLPVDQNAKSHRRARCGRAHDEMEIAGVGKIHDTS